MKKKNVMIINETEKNSDTIITMPLCHKEGLPYYDDIRASWKVNQRHCDPNSPEKREHYIARGIKFCDEWLGELGWMRYYIFHMDAGYVKGKSKLIRIDDNKGFNPSNCIIKDKVVNKSKEVDAKPKVRKTKCFSESKIDSITPANVTNHIMVFADGMKPQDIIELLMSGCNKPMEDEHNKIIYLNSTENQTTGQKKAKS